MEKTQSGTRHGGKPYYTTTTGGGASLAGALVGYEGLLAKIVPITVNGVVVAGVSLPNSQTDFVTHIINDGSAVLAGSYDGPQADCVPIMGDANRRTFLNGTCNPGDLLVSAPIATRASITLGDAAQGATLTSTAGFVQSLPTAPGVYFSVGIAEEAGIDGQLVKYRPTLAYITVS